MSSASGEGAFQPLVSPGEWQFSFPAMGTRIDIKGYGGSATIPPFLADRCCEMVKSYEDRLSRFRNNSDICELAKNSERCPGEWVNIHPITHELLVNAQELSDATSGCFSLLTAPLTALWSPRAALAALPDCSPPPHALDQQLASQLCAPANLDVDSRQCRARLQPGACVDLGGIAKGKTADALRDMCCGHGVKGVLVSIGTSSIAVEGSRADGSAWQIGLQDPFGIAEIDINERIELGVGRHLSQEDKTDSSSRFSGTRSMSTLVPHFTPHPSSRSLSTSGDHLGKLPQLIGQGWERFSHVFDPRTGKPACSRRRQVTVCADSGVLAEVLSTAILVGGIDSVSYQAIGQWAERNKVSPYWSAVVMETAHDGIKAIAYDGPLAS